MHRFKLSLILILASLVVLATAYAALAAPPPPQSLDPDWDTNPAGTVDYQATPDGQENVPYANPGVGRLHSGYTKNTDACAACHAPHTGVGPALLQWSDTTTTCLACHDGSVTSTYDVVNGEYRAWNATYDSYTEFRRTSGGLFNLGLADTPSLSRHDVTYDAVSTTTGAAPGGNPDGVSDSMGKWADEFSCASCHSPHGQGGNARALNPDPNGFAMKNKRTGYSLTKLTSTTYAAYVSDDAYRLGYRPGDVYTWISGYPYSPKVFVDGVRNSTVTVDNSQGYSIVSFPSAPSGTVTAEFVPAVRVAISYGTNGSVDMMTVNESITYKQGINAFCGACHMDYNTAYSATFDGAKYGGSAEVLTGQYTEGYRHQVGYEWHGSVPGLKFEPNSTVVCLTCHVAHGTDQDYWIDSLAGLDGGFWTTDTAVEIDGSSALKRKPNMGVCESCHSKGSGNAGYSANTK